MTTPGRPSHGPPTGRPRRERRHGAGTPSPVSFARSRSDRPRSVTAGQETTPVPSTAVGTTCGWAAHRRLMDGATPAGTPTGTASRPALRRWPVPAGASVATHASQGPDEAGGTSQGGAMQEAPARTQQERGRRTADTEPTAQHGTGRRTGCARAAPSARTSRQAHEQRCHSSHTTTMTSNCSRGDSGLPSTTAASQTVADPAASCACPECYTPTYPAPRLGTDARCEPCRSTLGTERRRKRVPSTEAPMPEWTWSEGVDVPPAASDCGACAPDPNRRQHRGGGFRQTILVWRATAAGQSPLSPHRTFVLLAGLHRLNPQVTALCPAKTLQVPGRRTRKQAHHDAHTDKARVRRLQLATPADARQMAPHRRGRERAVRALPDPIEPGVA
jgi:hypothetical protein